MTDPYIPTLDAFSFTEEEAGAIDSALATEHPWDVVAVAIASAKEKIRAYHLARHSETCCYCRTNLHGGGPFMIDREHILPKGKYKAFTFAVWNLSISCKRCNLQYKGREDDFVVDKQPGAPFQNPGNYRIVHPNYDKWESHLDRLSVQRNASVVVKYAVVNDSEKGRYTHTFFSLHDLEINSFDESQGLEQATDDSAGVLAARLLAKQFGQ